MRTKKKCGERVREGKLIAEPVLRYNGERSRIRQAQAPHKICRNHHKSPPYQEGVPAGVGGWEALRGDSTGIAAPTSTDKMLPSHKDTVIMEYARPA